MTGAGPIDGKDRVIEVRDLTRHYGKLKAIERVSFDVGAGEIFGFLGPNGAGKTTTISVLTTLLKPSGGSARICGHDVVRQQAEVRRSIGLVFQEPSLDERLTAAENLRFHAVLYAMPANERRSRIAEILEMVGLRDRADDRVERFSGGMKRRLEIARGLLHTPKVLFLDEPTIGLDPQTRRSIWEHILELRERTGVTVFMTTHYMDEAEVCDRIAVIDHGRVVALDAPEGLKRLVGGDVVTAIAPGGADSLGTYARESGLRFLCDGDRIRFEVDDGPRFIPRLVGSFPGLIEGVSLHRPTLDDVFLGLTGHAIRDAELDGNDVARARTRALAARHGKNAGARARDRRSR